MAINTSIAPPRLDLLQENDDHCILVLERGIGDRYPAGLLVTNTRLDEIFSAAYNDRYAPTNAEEVKARLRTIFRNYPIITYCSADINHAFGERRGTVKGTDVSTQHLWSTELVKRKANSTMPAGVEKSMIHLESSFHPGSNPSRDLWEDARNVLLLHEASRESLEAQGSSISDELQRLGSAETQRRYEQSRRDRAAHDKMIKVADEAVAVAWKLEMERTAREAKALVAQRVIEAEKALEAQQVIRAANMANHLTLGMERYASMVQEQCKTDASAATLTVEQQSSMAVAAKTKPIDKASDAFASCLVLFNKRKVVNG
ncbi:hypothetical protein B0A48_00939 [Cryoendolithus antarcticus]|uniref:Uncharacterized protein n=1 Tax=Cryoendolithus antarcticus TaxID=1507870 RepID=A0A1V8TRS1_9PEZI|nr:hypothetical protein B0A48_00939 [Cryoendolithus antarcticus]